jgi:uncharacterized protein DUF1877
MLVTSTQLESLMSDPSRVTDFLYEDPHPDEDQLDIDKSWHGIHFVLTGTAWDGTFPLNFLVSGGKAIGDVDVGYGPARGFTEAEVQAIAESLVTISPESLRPRLTARGFAEAEIYPSGGPPQDVFEEDQIRYFLSYFEELVYFVRWGAASRKALLVWLS